MIETGSDIAVAVQDLEKRFGAFAAVDRVTFQVRKGEVFGFLGPNGAGKSTTIRMLCGILSPTGGSGTVAGFDIRSQPEAIKANIGYMSQKFSLYQDLTVEENIDFYSGIYRIPRGKKDERKQWVLEMSGLVDHRHALTAILSGGWKQRLALGCAILHEPPIIFLDEPTSGVDPISRRQFWDLIYELSGRGVTVFVTTHYMDEAEYCDRLGLIYRGQLIAAGTPEALKKEMMQEDVLEVVCRATRRCIDGDRQVAERSGGGDVWQGTPRGGDRWPARGVRHSRVARPARTGDRAYRDDRAIARRRVRVADRGTRPRRAAAGGGARMNPRRVWAVARKEFLHVLRDFRSLLMAIATPALVADVVWLCIDAGRRQCAAGRMGSERHRAKPRVGQPF